jgi:thiol peroxidase
MAKISLHGDPVNTSGELPKVGEKAKDFSLIATDLSTKSLANFKGKKIILNIFPSVDTGTCAKSVRQFNQIASELKDTVVLCISRDLPFAQTRFCGAEGLTNVYSLSDFATGQFGKDYGLEMLDGKLKNLHSRVVVILDDKGIIKYTEQVPELTDEPNYDAALKNL